MVWAGIMINGRTRLHVVANGTMTGQRYIDEVLLLHDCPDSEGIQRLVWLARSPDLNPTENVWDALGRQVAGRNYPPTNKNTLIRALTEEWDKLPQQLLDNAVQNELSIAVVVDYATSSTVTSDEGPRNSSRLRARFLPLSLALALSTMHVTVLDESRSFFRVHTSYFSNIPKCIKAEFIASWACSQSSVVSSSKR
ncbi:transposable element Tc1 transposase [Trichonephila clavipes]|nr:transposable element Tc1 transposase [Trichonephila clavipes]